MPRWVPVLVAVLTVVQLLVGAFSGHYAGKALGWRLLAGVLLALRGDDRHGAGPS